MSNVLIRGAFIKKAKLCYNLITSWVKMFAQFNDLFFFASLQPRVWATGIVVGEVRKINFSSLIHSLKPFRCVSIDLCSLFFLPRSTWKEIVHPTARIEARRGKRSLGAVQNLPGKGKSNSSEMNGFIERFKLSEWRLSVQKALPRKHHSR